MSAPVLDRVADGSMVMFWCPGCLNFHGVWLRGHGDKNPHGASWDWNGDLVRPTFSPSILVRVGPFSPNAKPHGMDPNTRMIVCHSFVREGRIEFLTDCTHAMAGQTVDLTPTDAPTEADP